MTQRYTDIAEVKARVAIENIVGRKVALRKNGAEFVGLCPFHDERTPSFTVVPRGPKSQDGFFYCHGCRTGGDVIQFVIKVGWAADIRNAVLYLGGSDLVQAADAEYRATQAEGQAKRKEAEEQAEKMRRLGYDMWKGGQEIDGTPAAEYFRETRGWKNVPLPTKSILRFHPGLWRKEDQAERPCIMAAMTRADGSFGALHRTWIAKNSEGRWVKLKPTRMLGPKAGCAIRLYPNRFDSIAFPADSDSTLYIAEGIETAGSVLEGLLRRPQLLPFAAVWAAGDLGNLSRIVLPSHADGVCFFKNVVMCMDADSDAGAAMAAEIHGADHYAARGCAVRVAYPPPGYDLNDLLVGAEPKALKPSRPYNPVRVGSTV